ncbi:hypothetical protein LOTGIDRAFT_172730 [Lottia gigantea]|uniref:SUEL-type lectin domain-containing protein n=1 Tax=Lottia gigantea TaxID=225164 RepID=V4AV56_LOTGI|nr:hypothetical protein LOTGIDRAFT_172730 [Lottia gigantea]ESP01203.1 hypothetical protein LOTGIDRAFT_172730 [Lottia gigantea]
MWTIVKKFQHRKPYPDKLYSSEICSSNGHDIQCGEGEKVAIKNLECGSGSHACAPFINRTIFAVCNGQRYCGDLDLRSMVNVYCDNLVVSARKIDVYYRCETGTSTSCRVNVCPENSPGLKCLNGGVIHVKKVFCKYEGVICSWETYVTLYTLCEARSQCSAGALKTVLPVYCEEPEVSQRNVLVDYVCINSRYLFLLKNTDIR